MKNSNLYLFILTIIILSSCGSDLPESSSSQISGDWLISTNQIFDGGPGRDGIPALENPQMISVGEAAYLDDNDLVIGVVFNGEARAYSHIVLDWHEIVNDQIGQHMYALTYCPLTGTAINWNRNLDGTATTFGVSGLLFNTNLIPFDRATNSNWSQMRTECVNGSLIGNQAELMVHMETTWGTWKSLYPNTTVVSTNTGISRQYGTYPYINNAGEDYRVDPFLIFPVGNDDSRLDRKERVLGVKAGEAVKAYRFNAFADGIAVKHDEVGSEQVVIMGSEQMNFLVAYGRELSDGTPLTFETTDENMLPIVMTDDLGNSWDVFGRAISGPNAGEQLSVLESYIGYWFAWAAFNPNIEIAEF